MNKEINTYKKKSQTKSILIIVIIFALVIAILLIVQKFAPKKPTIPTESERTYANLIEFENSDYITEFIIENFNEYPLDLINLYLQDSEGYGDFAYNYIKHKNDYQPCNYKAEELSGGAPILLQKDFRWGYEKVTNEYIAAGGCLPTSLTMAYIGLTGKSDLDPKIIAQMAADNEFVGITGFTIKFIKWFCDKYNFSCIKYEYRFKEEFTMPPKEVLVDALNKGHYFAASCRIGVFTSGGHAILITGYDEENDCFRVNDPDNLERSQKTWTYEELAPELETIWDIGFES